MTSQDKENILSFSAQVDKKDLQSFSQALMNQVINLQVENQRLLEKVAHLETLLVNLPVTTIGNIIGGISSKENL